MTMEIKKEVKPENESWVEEENKNDGSNELEDERVVEKEIKENNRDEDIKEEEAELKLEIGDDNEENLRNL